MTNVKRLKGLQGLLWLCLVAAPVSIAVAKLPPLSDEAKAKAAEMAAKTAWGDKTAAYQLCQSQDKVAAKYRASAKAAAAAATTSAASASAPTLAPCADPGPFQPAPPIEAAGAHSPATTAAAPPSGAKPQSETLASPKAK